MSGVQKSSHLSSIMIEARVGTQAEEIISPGFLRRVHNDHEFLMWAQNGEGSRSARSDWRFLKSYRYHFHIRAVNLMIKKDNTLCVHRRTPWTLSEASAFSLTSTFVRSFNEQLCWAPFSLPRGEHLSFRRPRYDASVIKSSACFGVPLAPWQGSLKRISHFSVQSSERSSSEMLGLENDHRTWLLI